MAIRDKEYWDELRTPGIAPEDARAELETFFKAQPLSIKNHDGVQVQLRLSAEVDADHVLYKDGERRKKADALTRKPTAFLKSRAERLRFVAVSLLDPDEIRAETKHPQARYYVCHVSTVEKFMVIVERPSRHVTYFLTAFEVDLNDPQHRRNWHRRMNGSTVLYMRPK